MNFAKACLFFLLIARGINGAPSVTLRAAGALTYNHQTGGGAWNNGSLGDKACVVDSLNANLHGCGEIVTFFHLITGVSGCINVSVDWYAATTLGAGIGYGDLVFYGLNGPNKIVINGNNCTPSTGCSCGGSYPNQGTDCAYISNGDETITLLNTYFTAPMFSSISARLVGKFQVCGLTVNEQVVVRYDVRLYCAPVVLAIGNVLQAVDTSGYQLARTVNMNGITNVLNNVIDCVFAIVNNLPNIITIDITADVEVFPPSVNGGSYKSKLYYSWAQGQYKLVNLDANALVTLNTFEISCNYLHLGKVQYTQSSCGCQPTFVPRHQPMLFVNVNASIFGPIPVTTSLLVEGTITPVYHYKRATNLSVITDLFVSVSDPTIPVQAVWEDGTIWKFANVLTGTLLSTVFDLLTFPKPFAINTGCSCKKQIAIAIVLQRDVSITVSDYAGLAAFVGVNFANGFGLNLFGGYKNALIGIHYYDGAGNHTALSVRFGTSPLNVFNTMNRMSAPASCGGGCACPCASCLGPCPIGLAPCGSGRGLLHQGIDGAVADLLSLKASGYAGSLAILTISKGIFPDTYVAVKASVNAATLAGITVMATVYDSVEVTSQLTPVMVSNGNPDYFHYRYLNGLLGNLLGNLITVDSYWPITLIAKMCTVPTPCATGCCGVCDSVCGTCTPLTSCPVNCSNPVVLNQFGCCVPSPTNGTCPKPPGLACSVNQCNATSGQCTTTTTNSCGLSATDTNCFSYTCNSDGTCTKTPLWTNNLCFTYSCVANVIVPAAIAAPINSNLCIQYNTCINSSGWVASATVSPNPGNNCVKCDPSTGFYNVTCTPSDDCHTSTCDPASGACSNIPVDCIADHNNLCDTSQCVVGSGCVNSTVTCAHVDCQIGRCVAGTGNCVYSIFACNYSALCCGVEVCASDACSCGTACPPAASPTVSSTCTCAVNDACSFSYCLNSTDCSVPVVTNCTQVIQARHPNNNCITAGACDGTTGCAAIDVTCTTPSDPCQVVYADPDATGCCVTASKSCGTNTGCLNWLCNSTDGSCFSENLCTSSDLCNPSACNGTTCAIFSVVCNNTDPCLISTCDPTSGVCIPVQKNCDDNNLCTVDSCVSSVPGGCVHDPVICPAASDPCSLSVCDHTTGGCSSGYKSCDDNIACTVDSCENTTGFCVNTPVQSLCTTADPCLNSSVCYAGVGCVTNETNCSLSTFCAPAECIPYQGCTIRPIDCSAGGSNESCTIYNCSDELAQCQNTTGACFNFAGVVAGIVVAGVVVGTIAGATLLAGAITGGTAYAISTGTADAAGTSVSSNPIYEESGKSATGLKFSA